MRILHLTPELPSPELGGCSARQYYLLRRLVELGHEVQVVAPVAVSQRQAALPLQAAGIEALTPLRPQSRIREAISAMSRRPALVTQAVTRPLLAWQVEVFWTSLQAQAQAAIQRSRPDVISVETDNAASWASDVDPSIPALLTLDDVSWTYYAGRAEGAAGLTMLALALEARRFRRHDLRHVSRYRTLITVSESEARELRRIARMPVEVIPNGFDTQSIPAVAEEGSEPVVLFTGTMSHPPNIEAIGWFVEHVWPIVAGAVPDVRLAIVGRDPPRDVRRLADQRIEVTGEVPSTLPYFARARVAIVPMRSGGTTRVKLLEALGAGRAVVTTPVGAEGVALRDGQEALIAADPDAFAAAVVRLLTDADLRREMARRGRRLVERQDWRVLGDRFEQTLLACVDHPQPARVG